jgi:hypothetical protein
MCCTSYLYMLPASAGFLLGSLLDPKDGYIPPKHLVFSELHGITTQKTAGHVYCCENVKYNNFRTDSLAVWPAFGFRFILHSSPQLHEEHCGQTEYVQANSSFLYDTAPCCPSKVDQCTGESQSRSVCYRGGKNLMLLSGMESPLINHPDLSLLTISMSYTSQHQI